jgi:hypothetical protein
MKTTKETPNTPTKPKGGNSPFRKFEELAKKIVRAPKPAPSGRPSGK